MKEDDSHSVLGLLHLTLYLLYSKTIDPVNRLSMTAHKGNSQAQKKSCKWVLHQQWYEVFLCGNVPCYTISVWAEHGTAGSAGARKEKRSWTAIQLGALTWVQSCLVCWYCDVFQYLWKLSVNTQLSKTRCAGFCLVEGSCLPALARGTVQGLGGVTCCTVASSCFALWGKAQQAPGIWVLSAHFQVKMWSFVITDGILYFMLFFLL